MGRQLPELQKFYIQSSHPIPCGSTTWIWVDYLDVNGQNVNGPRYVGKWEANSMHGWGRLVYVSIVCWPGAWPNHQVFLSVSFSSCGVFKDVIASFVLFNVDWCASKELRRSCEQ